MDNAQVRDFMRFYNGGDGFTEKFNYTKPGTDFKEENGVAYWHVTVKKQGFFQVPRELTLPDGNSVLLLIHKEITHRYGDRGVILINENIKDMEDGGDYVYVANCEKMAKEKGSRFWKEYCQRQIVDFEQNNEVRVMQKNLPALRPSPFIVHAYQELGMQAPDQERWIKAGLAKEENSDVKDTLELLMAILTPDQKKALEEAKKKKQAAS